MREIVEIKSPKHIKNGLIRQLTFFLQDHLISFITLIPLIKTSLLHMAKLLPDSRGEPVASSSILTKNCTASTVARSCFDRTPGV